MRITTDVEKHGQVRLECDIRVPLDVALAVLRTYEEATRPASEPPAVTDR